MNIDKIHERILFDLNKEQVGYVARGDIDLALDRAQMNEFYSLLGNPEEYRPGSPVPRKAYGNTTKINQALNPFKERFQFQAVAYTASPGTGTGPIGYIVCPSDFIQETEIYLIDGTRVDIIKEDELPDRLQSSIIAPVFNKPIAVRDGIGGTINGVDIGTKNKIKLYPEGIMIAGTMWYMRRPDAPFFSYNLSGREILYVHSTSIQMEWDDVTLERIINRAIGIIARNLQSSKDVQFAEMKNDKGV